VRTLLITCVALLAGVSTIAAQGMAQQFFEAGQYDEALQAIAQMRERGEAGPAEAFLAGQVLVRQNRAPEAEKEFASLETVDGPVWMLVGESAVALLQNDNAKALDSASRAVAAAPGDFYAQYELGLSKVRLEDWAGGAEAFARAAQINPTFAYAHYYAGLAYSRIRRADRTAEYMDRFLKLAPMAPEKPGVESLMRTLRGR
jgi:tetratricopeptide (TPR) repeat protein